MKSDAFCLADLILQFHNQPLELFDLFLNL
jgi:hypothetical protein